MHPSRSPHIAFVFQGRKSYRRPRNSSKSITLIRKSINSIKHQAQPRLIHLHLFSHGTDSAFFFLFSLAVVVYASSFFFLSRRSRYTHNVDFACFFNAFSSCLVLSSSSSPYAFRLLPVLLLSPLPLRECHFSREGFSDQSIHYCYTWEFVRLSISLLFNSWFCWFLSRYPQGLSRGRDGGRC
jgi:hypothetical protein